MNTLPLRAIVNGLLRHPLQAGLAVIGLALGVMVYTAVDIATQSAQRAFTLSMNALAGRATHHIVAGSAGLPDSVYRRLRVELGVRESAPVAETAVRYGDLTLQLLGVDLFAEQSFRSYLALDTQRDGAWRELLLDPGAVLLGENTAARLGLRTGARLAVQLSGITHQLVLVGTLDDSTTRGIDDLLVADIATVKSIRGQPARLSRIDLILPPGDSRLQQRIAALLPPDARIEPASARLRSVQELTRAFTLNLTAMSLLAVVIGVFLIYNTMHFTLLRRRAVFGALRALGVGRRELLGAVLLEAAVLGALATVLGTAIGVGLAGALLDLVSRTINDLYFTVSVREAALSAPTFVKAALLGLSGSLLAVLVPAWETLAAPPLQALQRRSVERKAGGWLSPLAGAGAALLAASWLLVALSASLAAGFVALALLLFGASALVPWLSVLLSRALARLVPHALYRHAVNGIEAGISRLGVAQAALVVALSATVGVTLMVGSFRVAVEQWLESTLRADIYVRPTGAVMGQDETRLREPVVARIAGLPGVDELSLGRVVTLHREGRPVSLFAIQMAAASYRGIALVRALPDAWRRFDNAQAVLVSEPYAYHNRVRAGDRLVLPAPDGPVPFEIAGIYRDYGSERGVVMMRMSLYRELWRDHAVSSLGVYLHSDAAPPELAAAIRAATVDMQQLRVRSNRELREASLTVFDRTFQITNVLRWLTIIVAVVAIVTSLSAVQMDRRREFALLRGLGMSARQLGLLTFAQTGLLGLIAGLLALPAGIALSYLLIRVINRRAFGWSMDFAWQAGPLFDAIWLAVLVALLAAVLPVRRALRAAPAQALRGE